MSIVPWWDVNPNPQSVQQENLQERNYIESYLLKLVVYDKNSFSNYLPLIFTLKISALQPVL